jgi:multicomponent Na+:H+ antiporter subunit E
MIRLINFIRYAAIFLRELVIANYQVTVLVLSPSLKIKPGFLSMPMRAETDFEVTSLANSITLTPGTISVHIPDSRDAIVIHALDIGADADDVRHGIKTKLESNILRFTRPAGRREIES